MSRIKEVLFELGYKDTTPTPEYQTFYMKWTGQWQLQHEVILIACKQCVRKKLDTSFETVDVMLKRWVEKGLRTKEDIKEYLKRRQKLNEQIQAVLERVGEERSVTPADRKLFLKWTEEWKLPYELILQAAEYSVIAENKLSFMNKILYSWYNSGIRTVEEARTDHERHLKGLYLVAQNKSLKKQVDFSKFEQHTYTDEELEFLFEDIENG